MGAVRWKEVDQDGQRIVKEIYKVVVHKFKVSDVEDPVLYAAEPLWQWENSEQGKFVMANCIDTPCFEKSIDHSSMSYTFIIIAEMEKSKLSEFYLRWGKP